MAEAGDGNIKVVVRCRPLNSRGACHPALTDRVMADLGRLGVYRAGAWRKTTHSHDGEPDIHRPAGDWLYTGLEARDGATDTSLQF